MLNSAAALSINRI